MDSADLRPGNRRLYKLVGRTHEEECRDARSCSQARWAGRGVFFAGRVPSSFLPDEDQGYLYVNMQLPNSASLERTAAAAAEVEKVLADTPGVQYTTSVIGCRGLRAHELQRVLLRHLETLGRTDDKGRTVPGNQGPPE